MECNPKLSMIRIIKDEENGIDLPLVCQQCETPVCMKICPVDAVIRDDKIGIVKIKGERCIGCRMCQLVCPLGAISLHPTQRAMVKCDLCEGDPECVKWCTTNAISYVDMEESRFLKSHDLLRSIVGSLRENLDK